MCGCIDISLSLAKGNVNIWEQTFIPILFVLLFRLLDMGLIPHTKIRVNKIAPMGDPMELFLRGYTLTLRKEDAHNITIEEDAE